MRAGFARCIIELSFANKICEIHQIGLSFENRIGKIHNRAVLCEQDLQDTSNRSINSTRGSIQNLTYHPRFHSAPPMGVRRSGSRSRSGSRIRNTYVVLRIYTIPHMVGLPSPDPLGKSSAESSPPTGPCNLGLPQNPGYVQ